MCGLVGIASANLIVTDKKVFTSLLYLDEIRGDHSTGVCAVNKAGEATTYKRALKASDFIQLKGYSSILARGERVLMGHNRYATMGARDDANAHPFTHDDITLVHNGTLKEKHLINSDNAVFTTDSETVAYAIANEDSVEVIERLSGAYALVWYSDTDQVLHFARNDERPLYIGKMGPDLVWASEKAMLELVGEHHKRKITDIELLPVGELRMYDIKNYSTKHTSLAFTPKKPPPVRYTPPNYGRNYGNSNRNYAYSRNNSVNSKIKKVVEATLSEVRPRGYFVGYTDDGAKVTGNVVAGKINELSLSVESGGRIKGEISGSTNCWDNGVYREHHFLTGNSVEVVEEVADSGTEKKHCQLCGSSDEKAFDGFEYHHGEYFHTSCLDDASSYSNYNGMYQ